MANPVPTTEDPFSVATREIPRNMSYFVTMLVLTPILCVITLVAIATLCARMLRNFKDKRLRNGFYYMAVLDSVLMICVLFHDVILTSFKLGITPMNNFHVYAYFYLATRPVKFVVAMVMMWSLGIILYQRLRSVPDRKTSLHTSFLSVIVVAILVNSLRWFDTNALYETDTQTGKTVMTSLIPRLEFENSYYVITMGSIEIFLAFIIPIFGVILPFLVSLTVKYSNGKSRDRRTLAIIIMAMILVILQTPHWLVKTLELVTVTSNMHFPNVEMITMATEFTYNLTPIVRCIIICTLCWSQGSRSDGNQTIQVVFSPSSDVFRSKRSNDAQRTATVADVQDDSGEILIPVVAVELPSNRGDDSGDSSNTLSKDLIRGSQRRSGLQVRWKSPLHDVEDTSTTNILGRSVTMDTIVAKDEDVAMTVLDEDHTQEECDQAMALPFPMDTVATGAVARQPISSDFEDHIEYRLPILLDDIGREMGQYEQECIELESMHQQSTLYARHRSSSQSIDRDVTSRLRSSMHEKYTDRQTSRNQKLRQISNDLRKSQSSMDTTSSEDVTSSVTPRLTPDLVTDSGCDSMNSDSDVKGLWIYTNPAFETSAEDRSEPTTCSEAQPGRSLGAIAKSGTKIQRKRLKSASTTRRKSNDGLIA